MNNVIRLEKFRKDFSCSESCSEGPYSFDELKKMIEDIADFQPADEDVYWFVNCHEAAMIQNNWKASDIASALQEGGIVGYNDHDSVECWLQDMWEFDQRTKTNVWYVDIPHLIKRFFVDMERM